MDRHDHWEGIYTTKGDKEVSWFTEHLERSLELIESSNLARDATIIDVGGGSSTLLDDLLDRGYTNVTVLDISAASLDITKKRLGSRAAGVT